LTYSGGQDDRLVKSAEKQLAAIDYRYQQRIKEKLRTMDDKNAPAPDIKKLKQSGEDHYRLRVGDYRIIFTQFEGYLKAAMS
jgi:mRNA-degrading endonuclease RelE of RelBE toxin-antitoxin system